MSRTRLSLGLPVQLASGTCWFAMLMLSGCGSDADPVTSSKTSYEVSEDDASGDTAGSNTQVVGDSAPGPSSPAMTPFMAANKGSSDATTTGSATPDRAPAEPTSGSGQPMAVTGQPVRGVPTQPPATPPVDLNASAASESDPHKLLALISQLQAQQPRGMTRAEALSDYRNTQNSLVTAADKILQQPVDMPARVAASAAKARAFRTLSKLGVPDANERLAGFCSELKKSDNAELVRLGRREEFAVKLDDFASNEVDSAQGILAEFKTWLSTEQKDGTCLQLGEEIARVLESRGFRDDSMAVLRQLGEAFAGSTDAALAGPLSQLRERVAALDLVSKVDALQRGEAGALEALTSGIDALLSGPSLGPMALGLSREIAYVLESNQPQFAGDMYAKISKSFADNPDTQLADQAKSIVQMYKRRSALIGRPFAVEGTLPDGKPFDWSRYSNKVVLVDFWATWCGPCLQEIPNIKKNYDLYRAKGFEVVGVNLDEDPQMLRQFLSMQPLPWVTVVSANPNARAFDHPLAVKCGVEAIPFLVLVDRSGVAIALNVRGEALGQKLAQLFDASSGS